jgi:hypothetical protein
MASLTEVFEGHVRTVTTPRRLHFGASLFAAGTAMVVGAIAVATTGVGEQFGLGQIAARQLAGVLAGLGLPAAFLGVFTVLPTGPNTRAAALIGASVSVLGVALFAVAYPAQWFGAGHPLAVVTVLVYFSGAVTTLACMFAALATFQTRNDPGGTARMEITEEGRVRLVEGADIAPVPGTPASAAGSVGLFGDGPDGSVQTQTNRASPSGPADSEDNDAEILSERPDSRRRDRTPGPGQTATADGGSAAIGDTANGEFTDAEFVDAARDRAHPDAYCGNCDHFEYVKVEGNITPYCRLQGDRMDDMDACTEWTETT